MSRSWKKPLPSSQEITRHCQTFLVRMSQVFHLMDGLKKWLSLTNGKWGGAKALLGQGARRWTFSPGVDGNDWGAAWPKVFSPKNIRQVEQQLRAGKHWCFVVFDYLGVDHDP